MEVFNPFVTHKDEILKESCGHGTMFFGLDIYPINSIQKLKTHVCNGCRLEYIILKCIMLLIYLVRFAKLILSLARTQQVLESGSKVPILI